MKPTGYPTTPNHLWNAFYDISQIPRPSKFEDKFRDYLVDLATKREIEFKVDSVGNVVIYKPGTAGRETEDAVIIQNHMDMVTDCTPDKTINFKEDPIDLIVEGDWLTADRTTLGADNGIGCAAAIALLNDETLSHPPLELLFTTDEETGLNGAWGVESDFFDGKKMINLDTEEWGSVYIGCAGGIDYEFQKSYTREKLSGKVYELSISGCIGGHSGVDIHEQRNNAIKILSQSLERISLSTTFNIVEARGGRAHNIIPRDAYAVISMKDVDLSALLRTCNELEKEIKEYCHSKDKEFIISLSETNKVYDEVYNEADSAEIMALLSLFPHGAHRYDLEDRELVATSNNMANIIFMNGKGYIQSSLRFFDRQEIKEIESRLRVLAKQFKWDISKNGEYPSWKPIRKSSLLDHVQSCYKNSFGSEAEVKAIHAGLECGILRDRIGPIDAISFGPTITGAHSPDERVQISTVDSFWKLFKNVLETI